MATQAPTKFYAHPNLPQLVKQHLALTDEPLLLAIAYKPGREPQDIFLFEVIENFGGGVIDPDRELFEVIFNSTSSFPLSQGQRVHLVLTNPEELKVATHEKWRLLEELRDAIHSNDSDLLYSDPNRTDLKDMVYA